MTKILEPDWLSNPLAQQIMSLLEDQGYQAYFVGGCVRNALLEKPATDLDLSTDARPDKVIELAERNNIKSIPTGIEHGTVTLVAGPDTIEVTTFRRDVATDGRRAVVAFADTLDEDARRRDFTVNALYMDRTGRITDPVDGLADIPSRHIRFIDDADKRIQEDYLRSLRFFRFLAWYGDPLGDIDADGLAATAANLDGLDSLSKERIGSEVQKLLSAPSPLRAIASMSQSGVLNRILPGADITALGPLLDIEGTAERPADWRVRLASMGQFDCKKLLRLSKQDTSFINRIWQGLTNTSPIAEIAYRDSADVAWAVALIQSVSIGSHPPAAQGELISNAAQAVFPIKASDLTDKFSGKDLGDKLKQLEAQWIASGFTLTKTDLLK